MDPRIELVVPGKEEMIKTVKDLFNEYAESLDFSLCFQGFDEELAGLPGEYGPPYGRLLLAFHDNDRAGCAALRRIDETTCEMKRLYLRPQFRGSGFGKRMAAEIIKMAQEIGYERMRLDTAPTMREAISLYHSLGFKEIGPYRDNPIDGAIFMELALSLPNA